MTVPHDCDFIDWLEFWIVGSTQTARVEHWLFDAWDMNEFK
jgi:hypothetical protein